MAIYVPILYCSDILKAFYGMGYSIPVTHMTKCIYSHIPYTVQCSALNAHTQFLGYMQQLHISEGVEEFNPLHHFLQVGIPRITVAISSCPTPERGDNNWLYSCANKNSYIKCGLAGSNAVLFRSNVSPTGHGVV
jgi:hypothetical protein